MDCFLFFTALLSILHFDFPCFLGRVGEMWNSPCADINISINSLVHGHGCLVSLRHCSQTWLHIRIMPGALKKSFPTLQSSHLMAAMGKDSALGHIPRGKIADSEDTGIFNFTDIVWVFWSWSTWSYPSSTSAEKSLPRHTPALMCILSRCCRCSPT